MAGPVRVRVSRERWNSRRFESRVVAPLDSKFGASVEKIASPDGFDARRLDIGDDETALFAWRSDRAYWLGNTETPEVLWGTQKITFDEAPDSVSEWAQRELYRVLKREEPWLTRYTHLAWFFLPVLMSKDGSDTTREFLRRGAGFPDAEPALSFYDDLIATGVFEGHRYTMASKLGTSASHDTTRMAAAMGEFNAASILHDSGYEVVPEPEIEGYTLDFLVPEEGLVEVTRPERREEPAEAVKAAASRKAEGQLNDADAHLLVDCSNFERREWGRIAAERSGGYEPAVFYWMRPDEDVEAYSNGDIELDLDVRWV